jgi:hypothetical protein
VNIFYIGHYFFAKGTVTEAVTEAVVNLGTSCTVVAADFTSTEFSGVSFVLEHPRNFGSKPYTIFSLDSRLVLVAFRRHCSVEYPNF